MKTQNKSDIITGIGLLIISALFSISLILQPFDFGAMGPGKNNIFYALGKMLYAVYGFSSVLIPVFFAIAGLSCFSSKWTARKTMRLLTALAPFFTCVITENICRSILKYSGASFSALKMIVALVTGAMLMTIEFLGIGIFADKIQEKYFGSKRRLKIPRIKFGKKQKKSPFENKNEEIQSEKEKTQNPILDETFEKKDDNLIADENSILEIPENQDDENANRTTMITQEEFAALVSQDEEENSAAENENDELVWNLPPQPENLPPEYDADFDENDEALEFPPKDEEYPNEKNEEKSEPENSEENDAHLKSDFDENENQNENAENENETEQTDNAENFEDDELIEEYFDMSDAQTFEDENQDDFSDELAEENFEFEEENELDDENRNEEIKNEYNYFDINKNAPNFQKKSFDANDPYVAANYVKEIVKKSQFPYGIVIREDSEENEETESENDKEAHRSKFPTKINLEKNGDDNFFLDKNENLNKFAQNENSGASVFDVETPAISARERREQNEILKNAAPNRDFNHVINLNDDDFIPDDFEDAQEEREEIFDENSENREIQKPGILSQVAQESFSKNNSIKNDAEIYVGTQNQNQNWQNASDEASNFASDVFKEMEDEIRRDFLLKQAKNENPDAAQFENGKEIKSDSARNLTADELTDFFNAQQEENTPKGVEIQANPAQIGNRATKKGPYVIPSDLLIAYKDDEYWVIDDATKNASLTLKQTLAEFNIEANIIGIKKGPVVTMFELLPAPGVKLRKIVELQDNIALNLAAQSVRIVAPIPGKQAVGIEVPNRHRSVVGFREIIEMNLPEWKKMSVPVILGKDILGKAQLIDLVKTPHMLIAGATGSGKSVCVNSLILSILYKRSFREVKLILVDPKVVELKLYNNIPHLLTPVITEPKKALQALKWALCEMERRYALLDQFGVRDVSTYNQRIKEQQICTEKLPYIVIIIDEFADLMATSGKELETVIARLTAMSRAVGIHLVLATQRPSVNVITGLIKANIPTRIAFMVASRTDSNIIIDTNGAEKLLGRGDMLYASAVDPAPIRIQGTFVTDREVEDVVRTVKEYGEPDYIDEEIFFDDEEDDSPKDLFGDPMEDDDPLYDQALEIVVQAGKASASYIQRKLKIGYNRAARLVEEMEERGIVGPANGSKPREIIHIP